jgi:hypothetical protein
MKTLALVSFAHPEMHRGSDGSIFDCLDEKDLQIGDKRLTIPTRNPVYHLTPSSAEKVPSPVLAAEWFDPPPLPTSLRRDYYADFQDSSRRLLRLGSFHGFVSG